MDSEKLLPVVIPRELFDFLMGVGEINGTSFGDLNAGLPGPFWWRALLQTAANAPTPENGLREALEQRAIEALALASGLHEDHIGDARDWLANWMEGRVSVEIAVKAILALQHNTGERDALPDDVRALVIAAREFWDIHDSPVEPESRALDQALEAFAGRVPFADEPALSQAPR